MSADVPGPSDEVLGRVRGSLSDVEYHELTAMLRRRRDVPRPDGDVSARRPPRGGAGKSRAKAGGKGNKRRQFGHSWWGQAWVQALEGRARLDPNRLPRGRTYARHGRVQQLELEPGVVTAFVQGSEAVPYRVQLDIRRFGHGEWERLLDAIASKAAHAAALLDGELEPGILDDAERAGADLLPGPGDLNPWCSCPDWADPCKHAAAVCYLIADELDADPFNLLLIRGMPRNEVLAGVRTRRQQSAGGNQPGHAAAHRPVGVKASEVYARHRSDRDQPDQSRRAGAGRENLFIHVELAQLGHVGLGAEAVAPPPLAVDPPAPSGIRGADLARLGADAARRAFAMLTAAEPSGLQLSEDLDVTRRAAALLVDPPSEADSDADPLRSLAHRAGRPVRQLERDALAWHHGGDEGLAVLHERWRPDPDQLDEGREALRAHGQRVRADGNRLTRGRIQLRLAPSGLWYRLDNHAGEWELHRTPAADPSDLL